MKIVRHRMKCHVKDIIFVKNCRKTVIKFSIYLIILSVTLLIALLPNILVEKTNVINRHARYVTDLKYILMWKNSRKNKKNFINHDVEYSTGQTEFIKQNCPFINCYITYNKTFLNIEEFDAVVFNIHDVIKVRTYNLTMPRSSNQIYIFKSFDSAERHVLCKPHFDNFFNWTWSYKLNSDIPHPFFHIFDNSGKKIGPKTNMTWNFDMKNTDKYKSLFKKKHRGVATVMNNCNKKMKNEEFLNAFVKEMKGYNYSVDIYGPCGQKKCGQSNLNGCDKMIDEEYFFQLVLEESFSPDFVTEQVANAMKRFAIPLVVGGSNLSSFLPPGSYINVKEFEIKKLSAILDYLTRDLVNYAYFFDWKQYYYYDVNPRNSVCDLCTKLNENNPEKHTSYKEFRKWWITDYEDVCERLKISKIFHLDY